MSRIAQLPKRRWRDRAAEAAALNAHLRAPGGTQTLHDIQAVSLLECWELGGTDGFANVGEGKTLIMGLVPTLMAERGFTRPLCVVPGALREKTDAEFAAARRHWRVASQYWLESYTALAQVSRADILDERQPDILIFDEPDPLRKIMSASAPAVAKRVRRYIDGRKQRGLPTCCVFLGATPYKESILDFAWMVRTALGAGSPFPDDDHELLAWSAYLDGDGSGPAPVEFTKHFGPVRDQEHAWDLFADRLTSTPGVIISDNVFNGAQLELNVYSVDPGLAKEFEMLRTCWQRPDGWDLADADTDADPDDVNTWSIWGVARQMAMGFYYKPDPPPPKEWASARSAWFKYVRQLIDADNSRFDTERQVRAACERSSRRVHEWERWRDVKDTFTPNSVPVWLSRHALDAARSWGSNAPGIIWTDHLAFGHRLAQESGWKFYGQRGVDASGARIEDAPGNRTVIASRLANQRGRNLQHQFNRNLIMAMPNAARDIEQLLGRTHRHGQPNDVVHVDVYAACKEHWRSLDKIAAGARATQRKLRMSQKWLGLEPTYHGDPPADSWAWR